jgi:hypothetical protein
MASANQSNGQGAPGNAKMLLYTGQQGDQSHRSRNAGCQRDNHHADRRDGFDCGASRLVLNTGIKCTRSPSALQFLTGRIHGRLHCQNCPDGLVKTTKSVGQDNRVTLESARPYPVRAADAGWQDTGWPFHLSRAWMPSG